VIDAKIGKKWMEVTVKKIDRNKGKLEVKVRSEEEYGCVLCCVCVWGANVLYLCCVTYVIT
jgi:hypothetical protein